MKPHKTSASATAITQLFTVRQVARMARPPMTPMMVYYRVQKLGIRKRAHNGDPGTLQYLFTAHEAELIISGESSRRLPAGKSQPLPEALFSAKDVGEMAAPPRSQDVICAIADKLKIPKRSGHRLFTKAEAQLIISNIVGHGGRPPVAHPWKELGVSRQYYYRLKSEGESAKLKQLQRASQEVKSRRRAIARKRAKTISRAQATTRRSSSSKSAS